MLPQIKTWLPFGISPNAYLTYWSSTQRGWTPSHMLFMTLERLSNQQLAIAALPASFGCTPSPVIVLVSNPFQQSTTVTGLLAVDIPGAHFTMASLSATTLWPQVPQFEGFIGMICATWTRKVLSELLPCNHQPGSGLMREAGLYQDFHVLIARPHLPDKGGERPQDFVGAFVVPHVVCPEVHHNNVRGRPRKPAGKL
jgi:hypothetical protein